VLDVRDKLLQTLSPESQGLLLSWVNDIRHDIKSWVPRGDMARYRMPE
jgi:hypothetical protein